MRHYHSKRQANYKRKGPRKRGKRLIQMHGRSNCEQVVDVFEKLSNSGMWQMNQVTGEAFFSAHAVRLMGLEGEQLRRDLHIDLLGQLAPKYERRIRRAFVEATHQGTSDRIQVQYERPDGDVRRFSISMFRGEGPIINGIIQDITEWVQREMTMAEQLKFIEDLFDAVPDPIYFKDTDNRYRYGNQAMLDFLGLKRNEFVGKTMQDVFPREVAEAYQSSDKRLLETGGSQTFEAKMPNRDGTQHEVEFSKALMYNLDHSVKGIVGAFRDITVEKQNQRTLKRMSALQQAMIWITHSAMENVDALLLYNHILGMGLEAIESADHGSILMRDEDGLFRAKAWRGYADDSIQNFELELEKSFLWHVTDGRINETIIINDVQQVLQDNMPDMAKSRNAPTVRSSLCAPLLVDGELYGLLNLDSTKLSAYDDTDRMMAEYMRENLQMALTKRQLYDRVIYLSQHDSLTGVYNRNHFENLALRVFRSAERYQRKLTIAMFDMNDLKKVNDTFGHHAGDRMIKAFADEMNKRIRETDILGRYGGDEFIALLEEADVGRVAKRLDDVLEVFKASPIELDGQKTVVSFSYGLASWPEDADKYPDLVRIADERMYEHKARVKAER